MSAPSNETTFLKTDGSDWHRASRDSHDNPCSICGYYGIDGWPHRKHPVLGWESFRDVGGFGLRFWVPALPLPVAPESVTAPGADVEPQDVSAVSP